jgi:ribonuclease E
MTPGQRRAPSRRGVHPSRKPRLAESTQVAFSATPVPDPEDVARAEGFAREAFVHVGEEPAEALAPGTPRRRALDAALDELAAGAQSPSAEWRRTWSLLLGLERLLSDDEPRLADGTLLNPHQVDALSGTLTALLAEAERGASANGSTNGAPPVLAPPVLAAAGTDEDDEEDEEDEEADEGREVALDDDQLEEQPEDPNASKRFWFEHATGAGKTVAAMGFVDASRTGGVLILTHRRNLVDQFNDELRTRGYRDRVRAPLMLGEDAASGPVTVETYQWFVRNAGKISSAYTIVICDEAHTALGEKTSAAIRAWTGPIFIGMTATGALIARHVTDLFPTQTSRFDLAQAARRGVIAPLRGVRIPPGPGVRTIAKVPLRRGEVDTEFDQEMLAELLDQQPFNVAVADLYRTRFAGVPGVVYAAGVRHAYNVAQAFRDAGLKAQAVSGETPKRELATILARYERGDVDVLVNAQLLAEGWNSPRATVCMHLAPTASRRIYQQRVGRVTRRHPGKEAGIVVDFVHPATKHDDPVVTLHSLLDRDVYRGGAIVVGPVRRGRGRRVRVERRVLPVTADENRRIEVFERELWRIAVEHLDYGEQVQWAALAGARVSPNAWRRARAMLHFDRGGELKRAFLLTALRRNKSSQLRIRALQEIAAARDAEALDTAIDEIGGWAREERREATKVMLQALAEKRIGRRDQVNAWIWRLASYTPELHEEYAVQRWPETKRLLGLLVNSAGAAHARNARRLVQASRKLDRRLAAALLAAARAHTPEAEEVLRGARTRMSRKPGTLSRELLRNFPKAKGRRGKRRRRGGEEAGEGLVPELVSSGTLGGEEALENDELDVAEGADDGDEGPEDEREAPRADGDDEREPVATVGDAEREPVAAAGDAEREPVATVGDAEREPVAAAGDAEAATDGRNDDEPDAVEKIRSAAAAAAAARTESAADARKAPPEGAADGPPEGAPDARKAPPEVEEPAPARRSRRRRPAAEAREEGGTPAREEPEVPKRRRRTTKAAQAVEALESAEAQQQAPVTVEEAPAKPVRRRRKKAVVAEKPADAGSQVGSQPEPISAAEAPAKPVRRRRTKAVAAPEPGEATSEPAGPRSEAAEEPPAKPVRRRRTAAATGAANNGAATAAGPKPRRRRSATPARIEIEVSEEPAVADDPREAGPEVDTAGRSGAEGG